MWDGGAQGRDFGTQGLDVPTQTHGRPGITMSGALVPRGFGLGPPRTYFKDIAWPSSATRTHLRDNERRHAQTHKRKHTHTHTHTHRRMELNAKYTAHRQMELNAKYNAPSAQELGPTNAHTYDRRKPAAQQTHNVITSYPLLRSTLGD